MRLTSSAKRGLAWLRSYLGRGKALRADIAGAAAFNADREALAKRVAEYAADRSVRAGVLSKFRSLGRDVTRLAESDATVDASTLADLNRRYKGLHEAYKSWSGGGAIRLDRDPYLRVLGSDGSKISTGDMFATRGMLNSMRGDRADSVDMRELRGQLAAIGPARDVAAIRRQLRRYYLTNVVAGAVGAASVGGAGYGTYKALSGEKKAADNGAYSPARLAREAISDIVAGISGEKRAAPGGLIGMIGRGWRGARRFGQLVAGSRYDSLNARFNNARGMLQGTKSSVSQLRSQLRGINSAKWRASNNMRYGGDAGAFADLSRRASEVGDRLAAARNSIPELKRRVAALKRLRRGEAWKVLGARTGVFTVGGGGLYAGMRAWGGNQQPVEDMAQQQVDRQAPRVE